MTSEELQQAIAWFESRLSSATMPGTRKMFGMALLALRERQEREKEHIGEATNMIPNPLTLDELREVSEQNEFCGAHIWIKDLESGWATVAITDRTAQDGVVGIWCVDTNDVYCEKDYGVTWLAYRSEPKEAQDER